MKQEEEEYIEEDTEGGGEEGEEGGIWIEGREGRKENEREGKGRRIKENEKEETIEIKLLNVQGLTEDKWIEILEETGDDSIMCLTETQKKVDDIKIVKDVKIIRTNNARNAR